MATPKRSPSCVHGDTGRAEELIRCRQCRTLVALPYGGQVRCHECGHETHWLGRYAKNIPNNSLLIDDLLPGSAPSR
jgi:LSD1 subclass zinc finger protein